MSMKHIEYVLKDIVTLLQSNLQTELNTISTEMATDPVSLTAPISSAYYIHEIAAIDQMPAIQVIADKSNVLIPAGMWNEIDHKIIIVCHVVAEEGKEDVCAKRAMRFARAVDKIILDHRTIDGTYINWYITDIDYKPMVTNGNDMKQEIWLNCIVKMIETA